MVNSKYFINYDCSFYPCHNLSDMKSCLFCSCPLYMVDCGGDFVMRNGIKDCSECVIPHTKEGCNYVLARVNLILGQLKLGCSFAGNGWNQYCN